MTSPTDNTFNSLRQIIQDTLGTFKDDVGLISSQIISDKELWDFKLAEFESQAQTIKDGTNELIIKANQVEEFADELDGKASVEHTHVSADVSDASEHPGNNTIVRRDNNGMFFVSTPTSSGNPASKGFVDEQLLLKADVEHIHQMNNIQGLSSALANKSDTNHSHTPESIGASALSHTHSISQIADLQSSLDEKADESHTHTQGDVAGLVAALNNKADANHNHQASSIVGLETLLDGKANTNHTHTIANITGLQNALDDAAGAAVWEDLGNRPTQFPPEPHTHAQADIVGLTALLETLATSTSVTAAINAVTAQSVGAVKAEGTTTTLWSGTRAQYNALPAATRNAPGFWAGVTP